MTKAPTEALFVSEEVLELTGATHRQLFYWVKRGYLRPEQRGPRAHIEWRRSDMQRAALLVGASHIAHHLGDVADATEALRPYVRATLEVPGLTGAVELVVGPGRC